MSSEPYLTPVQPPLFPADPPIERQLERIKSNSNCFEAYLTLCQSLGVEPLSV